MRWEGVTVTSQTNSQRVGDYTDVLFSWEHKYMQAEYLFPDSSSERKEVETASGNFVRRKKKRDWINSFCMSNLQLVIINLELVIVIHSVYHWKEMLMCERSLMWEGLRWQSTVSTSEGGICEW